MKIIVPMAGRGSRFVRSADINPEYKKPKPLINVLGKPMIVWAMESLRSLNVSHENHIFISLESQQKDYQIVDTLRSVFSDQIKVILIPDVTRGAVETALMAKEYFDHEEIIISDSDHYFNGKSLTEQIAQKHENTMGIIPVFKPPDEEVKWSYTLFDKETYITYAVGEKDPVLAQKGAYANIGGYYFSSGTIFKEQAEKMIAGNEMHGPEGKQEFYVAPLYQRMISQGMRVEVAIIPEVWGLGTPKDIEYFSEHFVPTPLHPPDYQ
jgi:UDP-N-acetylglucosamine diphosphorylase / glucose-1-phosphate thymidylyltransferase / UDP-N-acetylgalactosamine diphosphorylase / glucosamine-1-phosphate N-acetyltransferase / galactosamine-1-phosphate N-acetyltransferase